MTEIEELNEMKEKVEKAKEKKSRLTGQKEQLLSDLKTKYECESVESAKTLSDEKKETLSKKQEEFDKRFSMLKSSYNWNNM